MKTPLHVLMVEDSADDAKLLLREISRGDWTVTHTRVETAEQMRAALGQQEWDVVLCDYALPHFSGEAALKLLNDTGRDLPFIFVSGTIGEEIAVAAMKTGAHDYVMKGNLARLVPAIARELRDAADRKLHREAEVQLRLSEHKYRHLFQSMGEAALLVAEETGKIIDANEQAEILFGRTRDEILGLPSTRLHPSPLAGSGMDLPGGRESKVQHKDGTMIPVHLSATRIQLYEHPLQLLLFRDISERKLAEAALRNVLRHARTIVLHEIVTAPEGWDPHAPDWSAGSFRWGYRFQDDEAAREVLPLDVPPGKRYHQCWAAAIHPDDLAPMAAVATQAFRTGAPGWDQEFRCIDRHGKVHWFMQTALIETVAQGRWRVTTINTDITERVQAEEAMRTSEERLSTIFHLSPTAICIVRLSDQRIIEVNEAFVHGTGYTREELIGHTPLELHLWEYPAEREAALRDVLTKGTAIAFKLHGRRKTGEIGVGVNSMARITLNGEEHLLSMIQDITELEHAAEARRESEQRLRQISENIDEVFWLTDIAKQEMIYISPAYERVWGRTCESLYARPESWSDAIHAEDRSRVLNAALTLQAAGEYNLEYRILRPDGSVRWVHDRAFPIKDAASRIYRIAGVAEDITAKHQLEDQLRQAQKMESLGTLAGGIAHDFNNILTGVLGSAEVARLELPGDHPVAAWLHNITVAGNRARDLVQQILTFGRKHDSEMAPRKLQCVVGEAFHLLRSTIPSMVQLESRIDDTCPPVIADDTQIHQVVMNLCTNAWHALPEQGGRIEVGLAPVEVTAEMAASRLGLTAGPYVRLTVRDNGRGMTPAVLARIFEPFFTTKKQGQGTGLGLAVVHGIIQSHQGAIFAQSTPDQGSLFEVFLPALVSPTSNLPTSDQEPLVHGQGENILLVDDDSTALTGLRIQLEHLGYRVTAVSDPRAALDEFLAQPEGYRLIITDYAMPDMSGHEFATKVLAARPGFPVILISGYIDSKQVQRARSLGVREFVRKPMLLSDLSRLLARHLPPG